MITAKQAYDNYLKWKNYLPIEKFVNSVLEYAIKDEYIVGVSAHATVSNYLLSDIFRKVFLHEHRDSLIYTGWSADYTRLPEELYGKQNVEILSELDEMYETAPEKSFVCRAIKALIFELEEVRGFKVELDLQNHILTVSWDLSSTENA